MIKIRIKKKKKVKTGGLWGITRRVMSTLSSTSGRRGGDSVRGSRGMIKIGIKKKKKVGWALLLD